MVCVTAHVDNEDSGKDSLVLIEPSDTDTSGGICVGRLIAPIKDGTVPVRLCNLRAKPVLVNKNMLLLAAVGRVDTESIQQLHILPGSWSDTTFNESVCITDGDCTQEGWLT